MSVGCFSVPLASHQLHVVAHGQAMWHQHVSFLRNDGAIKVLLPPASAPAQAQHDAQPDANSCQGARPPQHATTTGVCMYRET